MKKLIKWIKGEYYFLVNKTKFRIAKREADRLHAATGKEYHVLLNNGKFQVVDNNVVNTYNKLVKGKGKPLATFQIREMALYSIRK